MRLVVALFGWNGCSRAFDLAFATRFDRPTSGMIAVEVINDYGDDVMDVLAACARPVSSAWFGHLVGASARPVRRPSIARLAFFRSGRASASWL